MINRRLVNTAIASGLITTLSPLATLAEKRHSKRAAWHGIEKAGAQVAASTDTPDSPAFLRSQIDLASALITRPTNEGSRGFAVSPMSIAGALAIIAMGCDQSMRRSMKHALQIDPRYSDAIFGKILQGMIDIKSAKSENRDFPLVLANKVIIDRSEKATPVLLGRLQAYGIGVDEENLKDPAAIKRINAWVKQATDDLIPSIIDTPPENGGVVAVNALHFKDRWKVHFDRKLTTAVPFYGVDGKKDLAELMHREDPLSFKRKPGFVAVDIGFANERFSLVITTSTDIPCSSNILVKETSAWLAGESFSAGFGQLAVPHFDLATSVDLLGSLQVLGMTNRPLTLFGAWPPTMTAIAQKNVLKLDEDGAEAASVTAVIATRSIDNSYVNVTINKPFLFALRDKTTGLVLLAGYVARPQALKA